MMKVPAKIWVRRIISTVILLALLAGIGYLVYMFVTWVGTNLSQTREAAVAVSAPQSVDISECQPDEIDIRMKATPTQLYVSQGMNVTVTVSTKNPTGCLLTEDTLAVELTSGTYQVWTPTACAANKEDLLLADGIKTDMQFDWDARIYEQCEQVEDLFAEAGTYQLSVQVDGKPVGEKIPITIG